MRKPKDPVLCGMVVPTLSRRAGSSSRAVVVLPALLAPRRIPTEPARMPAASAP
jgi:hypothetical protein